MFPRDTYRKGTMVHEEMKLTMCTLTGKFTVISLAMVVTDITRLPFLQSLLPVMLNQKMRISELQT